jgi:hypothetical protein
MKIEGLSTELSTEVFSKDHESIAKTFLKQVIHLINEGGLEIGKYGIESNEWDSWVTEALSLKGETLRLELAIKRKK